MAGPMTLGRYRELAIALGGEGCEAATFFDRRIALQGADAEVLADECQMVNLIMYLNKPDDDV